MQEDTAAKVREEILLSAMSKLKAEATTVIGNIMSDLYSDYLPHVETDTESNISYRVDGVVHNLLAGKFERLDERLVKVGDGQRRNHFIHINNYDDLVKPLCAAMGADIESARIKQLENELQSLRQQLESAYRSY